MRTILITLCILNVTFSAKAQLFSKKWTEGCYYDLNGNKFTGLILWMAPSKSLFKGQGDQVFFKLNENADKVKLLSSEIKCFVMGKDSFVVSKFDDVKKHPFLSVSLDLPTKVYLSTTTISSGAPGMMPTAGGGFMMTGGFTWSGNNNVYYYGTEPHNLTKIERKNFVEVMSRIMADKPAVLAKIKDKTFKFGKLNELIEYYKTDILPEFIADDKKNDNVYQ